MDQQHEPYDEYNLDEGPVAEPGMGASGAHAKPSLKELWNKNPSLKVFAAIAGVVVLLVGYVAFGGSSDKTDDVSVVRTTKEVSQPPGTAPLPPAYEDAVRQASKQRAEDATQSGGSALPTPVARPSERIEAPAQVQETDPLAEWRREAEARRNDRKKKEEDDAKAKAAADAAALLQQQQAQQAQQPQTLQNAGNIQQQQVNVPPPLPMAPTQEQVNAYAQQLQQQMQTVMETQVPKESVLVKMNVEPSYVMEKYFPEQARNGNGGYGSGSGSASGDAAGSATGAVTNPAVPVVKAKPIVAAGSIAYGQTLMEANSDVPGPVLVQVASGPLLGARALGTFQLADERLVLQFTKVIKDGVEYTTQAIAVDPATTLPAMVTDVDHHYMTRVILPAAAAFVAGFAQAVQQTGTTTQVNSNTGTTVTNTQNQLNTKQELFKGVNEAGQQVSQVLRQDANKPVTVIVAAGTRLGLLFTSAVFDPSTPEGQAPAAGPVPIQSILATPTLGGQVAGAVTNAMGSTINGITGTQAVPLPAPGGTQIYVVPGSNIQPIAPTH